MASALANSATGGNLQRDLAHPPRWAAILDLCPTLAIPLKARLRLVYLIHVEDGEQTLIWGRAIFYNGTESVGFASQQTLALLESKHPGAIRWLSRIVKQQAKIAQNEPHRYKTKDGQSPWNKGRKARKSPQKADIVKKTPNEPAKG